MTIARSESSWCKSCSRSQSVDQLLKLWDGHSYCTACVKLKSPRLLTHALSHSCLEDSVPFDQALVRRSELRSALKVAMISMLTFAITGHSLYGPLGIAIGTLLGLLLTAIVFAVQMPARMKVARMNRASLRLSEGWLIVTRPLSGLQVECVLHECRWYLGKIQHDSGLRGTGFYGAPAVVLILPRKHLLQLVRERVACGYEDESREVWLAFLTLAGIRKKWSWRDAWATKGVRNVSGTNGGTQ